jgi:hypothetical protein
MCEELPVIPVDAKVDKKIIIGKKWRAKEEERHKGSLTSTKSILFSQIHTMTTHIKFSQPHCNVQRPKNFIPRRDLNTGSSVM